MPKWLTTRRDRESAKYRKLHAMLAAEVAEARKPEPSKQDIKRSKSRQFWQTGD